MIGPNATYLFKNDGGIWSANSEPFWTSLFALYLMHLSHQSKPTLRVWRPNRESKKYELRKPRGDLLLSPIRFSDIAIEAPIEGRNWPTGHFVGEDLGMKPDIVVKYHDSDKDRYLIIESKVGDKNKLRSEQERNYANLAAWLRERQIAFDILVLQSIGNAALFNRFSKPIDGVEADEFGLLLWEDAIASMSRIGFEPVGLPVREWLQFTEDTNTECDEI
jgi:hypothetical protein